MGHYRHYTSQTFSQLLNRNGFRVEHVLPNYARWHQSFTRNYALVRGLAMTIGQLTKNNNVFDFRLPGFAETAIETMTARLDPIRRKEAMSLYATKRTSTFVVARKSEYS
jgi:hypothetical protein